VLFRQRQGGGRWGTAPPSVRRATSAGSLSARDGCFFAFPAPSMAARRASPILLVFICNLCVDLCPRQLGRSKTPETAKQTPRPARPPRKAGPSIVKSGEKRRKAAKKRGVSGQRTAVGDRRKPKLRNKLRPFRMRPGARGHTLRRQKTGNYRQGDPPGFLMRRRGRESRKPGRKRK
jgi:hypothetical protein